MSKIPVGEGFLFPDDTEQSTAGVIPLTVRDFTFSTAGDNSANGGSLETPHLDPYQCVSSIGNLSPPVDSTNRASIQGAGTHSNMLSIPEFVAARTPDLSIISVSNGINVTLNGSQTVELGSMLSFVAGATIIKSDANTRVRCIVNALVALGDGSVGFDVSGDSDDSSYQLTQGELRGEGTVMFSHTAVAPTPIVYNAGVVEFFGENQTLIRYDPSGPSSQTVIQIAVCQPDGESTTTGSCVLDVMGGSLAVDATDLEGEFLAKVRDGATLSIKAASCKGKTLIEDGGQAVYKTVTLLTGDIETQGTGQMLSDIAQIIGDLTIGVGSTLVQTSDLVIGDITVNGRFDCDIKNHIGTLIVNGEINGIINGVRYGNRVIKKITILDAFSLAANQQPSGLGPDNAIQVEFGVAQNSGSDPVSLDADGTVNINQAGTYRIKVSLQFGRTGASSFSAVLFRTLVDGVQSGLTVSSKLDKGSTLQYTEVDTWVEFDGPKAVTFEIMRDALGSDEGGLFEFDPTVDGGNEWDCSPSATINIIRLI